MSMKPFAMRILLIGSAVLLCLVAVGYLGVRTLNRNSAIKATQKWARLAPFPKSSSDLTIRTLGSAFSREFRVTFSDEPDHIDQWLKASPGTQGYDPEQDSEGCWIYRIKAGGGAVAAKVRVSPDRRTVRIRAVWS